MKLKTRKRIRTVKKVFGWTFLLLWLALDTITYLESIKVDELLAQRLLNQEQELFEYNNEMIELKEIIFKSIAPSAEEF